MEKTRGALPMARRSHPSICVAGDERVSSQRGGRSRRNGRCTDDFDTSTKASRPALHFVGASLPSLRHQPFSLVEGGGGGTRGADSGAGEQ